MIPKGENLEDNQTFNSNPVIDYSERINSFERNIKYQLPVQNNNILNFDDNEIYQQMQQTYPLIHGSVLSVAHHFLLIKKKYGSNIEKKVYSNMSIIQFFNRLATKRAVVFFGDDDQYLLRNGYSDFGKWELIGTDNESIPKLKDYLSYDELLISALCGISSTTYFINDCNRQNHGKITNKKSYPIKGIYIGLVGARFEKKEYMEYSLMVINNKQNIQNNGYGIYNKNKPNNYDQFEFNINNELNDELFMNDVEIFSKYNKNKLIWKVFQNFYSKNYFPKYNEIKNNEDTNYEYIEKSAYVNYAESQYLNRLMFKQRIRVSLELFYFDSNQRAKDRNDKLFGAYCYVIGLGTGVWSFIKNKQNQLIVNVTKEIILESDLKYIDVIYFGWMKFAMSASKYFKKIFETDENGNTFIHDNSGHKITILAGRNNPADILKTPYDQCLKVAMYAWDSNAFPGNEYYIGALDASGDPAAASCSTISFVQNSEINKEFINGENSRIYFFDQQTNKYEFYKLRDIDFENNKEKWLKKSVLSIPYKRQKLSNNNILSDVLSIKESISNLENEISKQYGMLNGNVMKTWKLESDKNDNDPIIILNKISSIKELIINLEKKILAMEKNYNQSIADLENKINNNENC